jgi:hypothetical protein
MRVALHDLNKAGKWVRWAAAISLLACWSPYGVTQQRHDSLRVVMQLTPQADGAHAEVTVRIYNVSNRTINIWVPNWIDCDDKPGGVALEWKYKGDTMTSARAVQGIQSACIGNPPGLSESGPPSRESRAGHTWMHFAPGKYAEIHSRLMTGDMLGGKYEVRAIYRAPAFTREQQQDIRDGGLETPKGEYKSEFLSFVAPD